MRRDAASRQQRVRRVRCVRKRCAMRDAFRLFHAPRHLCARCAEARADAEKMRRGLLDDALRAYAAYDARECHDASDFDFFSA